MNLKLLTAAQRQIFLAISAHFVEKGSAPTYEDLAERLGGRSSATIHKHVHNLAALGMVRLSISGKIRGFKAAACPTCGRRKTAHDEQQQARKLGVKILQIWNDEEMPPKQASERLQAVIAEALREARA